MCVHHQCCCRMHACILHTPASPDTSQSELHIPSPVTCVDATGCSEFINLNCEVDDTQRMLPGSCEGSGTCLAFSTVSINIMNNMEQRTPMTSRNKTRCGGAETCHRASTQLLQFSLADVRDVETSRGLHSDFYSSSSSLNDDALLAASIAQQRRQRQQQMGSQEEKDDEVPRGVHMQSPISTGQVDGRFLGSLSRRPQQSCGRRLTSPLPDDREETTNCPVIVPQEDETYEVNIPSPFPYMRTQTNPLQASVEGEMRPASWCEMPVEYSPRVHPNAVAETSRDGRLDSLHHKISCAPCNASNAFTLFTRRDGRKPQAQSVPQHCRFPMLPHGELHDSLAPQEDCTQTPLHEELQLLGRPEMIESAVSPISCSKDSTDTASTPRASLDTNTPELVDWHVVVEESCINVDVTVMTDEEDVHHHRKQRSATQPSSPWHSRDGIVCEPSLRHPSIVSVADTSLGEVVADARITQQDVVELSLLNTLAASCNPPAVKAMPHTGPAEERKVELSRPNATCNSSAALLQLSIELCRAVRPFARRLLLLLVKECDGSANVSFDTCAEAVNCILEEERVRHVRATRHLCSHIVAASSLGEDGCRMVPYATFVASVLHLAEDV